MTDTELEDKIESDLANMEIAWERAADVCKDLAVRGVAIPALNRMLSALEGYQVEQTVHILTCHSHDPVEFLSNVQSELYLQAFFIGMELGKVNYKLTEAEARD